MIGLVYLVWGPLGIEPASRFLASYRAHPAGVEHELVLLLNDVTPSLRERLTAELAGTPHRLLALPEPLLDLAAYGLAAAELPHDTLCLANSYTRVLADGWLGHLAHALDQPDVAVAGATGSWESQAEWVRGKLRHWPYQLLGLRRARRDYPRFPNPHVRTTGFAMRRADLAKLRLDRARDKRATYLVESGRTGITHRLLDNGWRAVLAGRDGQLYDVERWPDSATYRSGAQRNLLLADRRTDDWQAASPRLRRRLAMDAWGDRALPD